MMKKVVLVAAIAAFLTCFIALMVMAVTAFAPGVLNTTWTTAMSCNISAAEVHHDLDYSGSTMAGSCSDGAVVDYVLLTINYHDLHNNISAIGYACASSFAQDDPTAGPGHKGACGEPNLELWGGNRRPYEATTIRPVAVWNCLMCSSAVGCVESLKLSVGRRWSDCSVADIDSAALSPTSSITTQVRLGPLFVSPAFYALWIVCLGCVCLPLLGILVHYITTMLLDQPDDNASIIMPRPSQYWDTLLADICGQMVLVLAILIHSFIKHSDPALVPVGISLWTAMLILVFIRTVWALVTSLRGRPAPDNLTGLLVIPMMSILLPLFRHKSNIARVVTILDNFHTVMFWIRDIPQVCYLLWLLYRQQQVENSLPPLSVTIIWVALSCSGALVIRWLVFALISCTNTCCSAFKHCIEAAPSLPLHDPLLSSTTANTQVQQHRKPSSVIVTHSPHSPSPYAPTAPPTDLQSKKAYTPLFSQ
jgi:uncharacterized membrane protein